MKGSTAVGGPGEVVDEIGGGDEARIGTVLNGLDRDGDGQRRLTAAGLAAEDEMLARGDIVEGEERGDEIATQVTLGCEQQGFDRRQEREVGMAGHALHASRVMGLITVRAPWRG